MWLVGQANGEFGRHTEGWLWAWFGVGNCSDRGRSLRRAAGLEPERIPGSSGYWPLSFGDAALLHSSYRAQLVAHRDLKLDLAGRRRTWSVAESDSRGTRIELRASPTKVVYAVKGVLLDSGRATVIVGFGEQVDDADFVALSVPDAHELVRRVQLALDTPLPLK